MEGLMIKGITTNSTESPLNAFLLKGQLPSQPDSGFSRDLLISQYTANRMKVSVNDSLILYFLQSEQAPRPKKIRIAGIYKTGIEQYDRLFAIADLRLIQKLNGWSSNQIGGYELFLKDPKEAENTAQNIFELKAFPQTWEPVPITRLLPNIFDWLSLMNNTQIGRAHV